ncbi:RNA-binding protein [Alteromonadaceae bacterium BrNp21-10]|nr:RNA-binding protein [Alteromonadaceae bacterium BrNp21-10]
MKSSISINVVITVVVAAIGYALATAFPQSFGFATTLAVGIVIGGLLISIITNMPPTSAKPSINSDAKSTDSQTLYVGNLPYKANEASISDLFSQYGYVHSVRLMKDRRTGKRKGYGFVEIDVKSAKKAISALNDTEFQERTLKVRMAKDKIEE